MSNDLFQIRMGALREEVLEIGPEMSPIRVSKVIALVLLELVEELHRHTELQAEIWGKDNWTSATGERLPGRPQ